MLARVLLLLLVGSVGLSLAVESMACVCVGCGNAPPPSTGALTEDPPPAPIAAFPDEKWFSSDDGWTFLAPHEYARNTAPGTTGFVVSRPPPPKLPVALVLTTEPFEGNVSAFVDKERAKTKLVNEAPGSFGIVIEETWPIGGGDQGRAVVLLAVDHGVGVRLACVGADPSFENQRSICNRAIESLRRAH